MRHVACWVVGKRTTSLQVEKDQRAFKLVPQLKRNLEAMLFKVKALIEAMGCLCKCVCVCVYVSVCAPCQQFVASGVCTTSNTHTHILIYTHMHIHTHKNMC